MNASNHLSLFEEFSVSVIDGFYGMGGLAPCPIPNLEGQGFLLRWPSLSHCALLFVKAPDTLINLGSRGKEKSWQTKRPGAELQRKKGQPWILRHGVKWQWLHVTKMAWHRRISGPFPPLGVKGSSQV